MKNKILLGTLLLSAFLQAAQQNDTFDFNTVKVVNPIMDHRYVRLVAASFLVSCGVGYAFGSYGKLSEINASVGAVSVGAVSVAAIVSGSLISGGLNFFFRDTLVSKYENAKKALTKSLENPTIQLTLDGKFNFRSQPTEATTSTITKLSETETKTTTHKFLTTSTDALVNTLSTFSYNPMLSVQFELEKGQNAFTRVQEILKESNANKLFQEKVQAGLKTYIVPVLQKIKLNQAANFVNGFATYDLTADRDTTAAQGYLLAKSQKIVTTRNLLQLGLQSTHAQ